MTNTSDSSPPRSHQMSAAEEIQPAGGSVKYVFVVLAAIAAVVFVMLMRQQDEPGRRAMGTRHPLVGKSLTKVVLIPCVNVAEPLVTDDLASKVVLINYWGTWCPPCREEFPHIVKLRGKFAGNDQFAFVSVSCSATGEDAAEQLRPDTEEYLKSLGADFPVYCDPDGKTRIPFCMAMHTDTFVYPTTVVVDRTGVIRGVWTGYLQGEEQDVAALVDELLAARE